MTLKALPGRNDPCPCGSGKKYKKCCLGKEAGRVSGRDPVMWFYGEGLPLIVDRYVGLLGDEALERMDDEWGYLLRPGDIEAMEACRACWMVLGWTGWREAAGVSKSRGRTIAEDVLRESPTLIDHEMREWLARVAKPTWSFYLVASNPRVGPCVIENLLTGERSHLDDAGVVSKLDEGSVLFAAMLPREKSDEKRGESRLLSLYPYVLDFDALESVCQLRERISEHQGFLTPRQLEEAQDTLRLQYFVLHLQSESGDRQGYDLRDGEEVVRVMRRYSLSEAPQLVLDALEDLARPLRDHDELLENAFFDEQGQLESVLVPWFRLGKNARDDRDFRIVATFQIEPGVLTVHTVSERLARNAYDMVRRRLGDSASLEETERSDPEGRHMLPELGEADELSPDLLYVLSTRPLHPLALTFHAMNVELSGHLNMDESFQRVLQDFSDENPNSKPGGEETVSGLAIALSAAGWSQGVDAHLLLSCVEHAAATPGPEAAWLLGALASTPGYGLLGERSRALAERAASMGIEPTPLVRAMVSEAYVQPVDGGGCRSLVARSREPETEGSASSELTLDAVFHLRHGLGFDMAMIVEPRSFDLLRRMRSEGRRVVPCSTAFARELVADALAQLKAAGGRVPSTYLFAAALLDIEPIQARARTPDLGAYGAELRVPSGEEGTSATAAAELIVSELFGCFWPHDDELYVRLSKGSLAKELAEGKEPPARMVNEVIEEFVEPRRAEIALGLASNLEFVAMEGRAEEPLSLAALHTWRAFAESTRPLRELPFARALAMRSLYCIASNLAGGVRSVAEAEQSR